MEPNVSKIISKLKSNFTIFLARIISFEWMFLFSSRKYLKFEKCYILLISNLKPTNNFKELMNQVIQIAL